MRRETVTLYGDQFEFLADCFELIRLRSDAYTLRTEAMETERMSRYADRHSTTADRNHLLEIYYDLERSIAQKEDSIQKKRKESEKAGVRFSIDTFAATHRLSRDEVRILIVL